MSDYIYKEGEVTTQANFTTENITHKPKRMQGDNIKKTVTTVTEQRESSVPVSVTIEGAIKYYEENAKGELGKLYVFTAFLLRGLLKKQSIKTPSISGSTPMSKADLINALNELSIDEDILCSMNGEPDGHSIVAVDRPDEGVCVLITE